MNPDNADRSELERRFIAWLKLLPQWERREALRSLPFCPHCGADRQPYRECFCLHDE